MFFFKENLREQLWFDSPNTCAAFLGISLIISTCLLIQNWQTYEKTHIKYLIVAVWGLFILSGQIILSLTYSRGGFLGYIVGLLFVSFALGRKIIIGLAVLFIATVLLVNDGAARIASVGDIAEASIRNRLLLWQGGSRIVLNSWPTGVGFDNIGAIYQQWYQPIWLKSNYGSMVL